jgi:dipeptidase D
MKTTTERVFQIFKELNQIPRPSHHEERVADYLCRFAERLNLPYKRDKENCVVISKPATPGYEGAEPIVLLNHMDMVCVGISDPLNTPIDAYIENGWMKARGTSLGADNGIGLSMALAVLESDEIIHGPLEVMTTTNEEDGMSGASQLSSDFLKGRKVINLDSEDYDTITTGAAGACLQFHRIPVERVPAPEDRKWYRIRIVGGLGGHSGVDINKGRCSAVKAAAAVLVSLSEKHDFSLATINIGEANASIASKGEMVIACPSAESQALILDVKQTSDWLHDEHPQDPDVKCLIEACEPQDTVISPRTFQALMTCLCEVPQGVVRMSEVMPGTVETSNNIGRVICDQCSMFNGPLELCSLATNGTQECSMENILFISTHTRSFIDDDMDALSKAIAKTFKDSGAQSEVVMSAPAWQEDQQSAFLQLTSDTFQDVLGWRPRMVAMHFVLEAGFFVEHYPGIQIASIGPRIVEPHSTSERVELSTIEDIWQVLIELLKRLSGGSYLGVGE